MSEAVIAADLQRELKSLTGTFRGSSVVIDDWSVLDKSSSYAPYAIIETANSVNVDGVQSDLTITWRIPVNLVVKFDNWDKSSPAMGLVRQAVIGLLARPDSMDEDSTLLSWGIRSISQDGEVSGIFDRYAQNPDEALPVFLLCTLVVSVDEHVQ